MCIIYAMEREQVVESEGLGGLSQYRISGSRGLGAKPPETVGNLGLMVSQTSLNWGYFNQSTTLFSHAGISSKRLKYSNRTFIQSLTFCSSTNPVFFYMLMCQFEAKPSPFGRSRRDFCPLAPPPFPLPLIL